ncbi:MAG: hypothetical protein ACRECH_14405 [Nitrososphaerales archaeon]
MTRKKKTRLNDACSYPGCDLADVGFVQQEDGSYAPMCAQHGALISSEREDKGNE